MAGSGAKHTADLALFTAELLFFVFSLPNKILPETVNMPEASLRGETDGTEELSVLRDYLLLPSVNPEQIRANKFFILIFRKSAHRLTPTPAFPLTRLLLPQHTPPES